MYTQGAILVGVSVVALWTPERFFKGLGDPIHGAQTSQLVKTMRCAALFDAAIYRPADKAVRSHSVSAEPSSQQAHSHLSTNAFCRS